MSKNVVVRLKLEVVALMEESDLQYIRDSEADGVEWLLAEDNSRFTIDTVNEAPEVDWTRPSVEESDPC